MNRIVSARVRMAVLLICDLIMILWESRALREIWQESGTRMFRYYTHDSNLLALLVCVFCAAAGLIALARGKTAMPRALKSLRLLAACGLMITFSVTAFVNIPIESGGSLQRYFHEVESNMLRGNLLYLHTLCPLLLFFSFVFLEKGRPLPRTHALLILPPTVLYGAITLYKNISHAYGGPYPFFHVYEQPVYMTALWMLLILLGAWLISLGLLELNRLLSRNKYSISG
ncbi:MAG: hypothetical protein IJE08_10725 [Clostridia bacterium]|nr:hypothetical protein [Clostridia bacterium]